MILSLFPIISYLVIASQLIILCLMLFSHLTSSWKALCSKTCQNLCITAFPDQWNTRFGLLQVQGIGMAPELMHHLCQLSGLQCLDAHGFEGSGTAFASHMPPPPLLPLACCTHLQWLDISHWTVTGPEVRLAPCAGPCWAAFLV